MRRIIRWLVSKGVTGFYPNGSMGEVIRLSYEERKRVLKIVVEEAAGKPILAGAAEPNVDLVHTPSLPGAGPRSDGFRCGWRESNFLQCHDVSS